MASRHAPSTFTPQVVATIAGLAAAGAIVYLCKTAFTLPTLPVPNQLHRSNALRRPHRDPAETTGNVPSTSLLDSSNTFETTEFELSPDQEQQIDGLAAREAEDTGRLIEDVRARIYGELIHHLRAAQQRYDEDAVTENDVPDIDPAQASGGSETQDLQELVFAISKIRAKTEGLVHYSIWCDRCSKFPIVGVRYKCINCKDFDLCEDCEAQDEHTRTHVFYKIRVPMPWSPYMIPQKPWYPGHSRMLPYDLPPEVHDYVSQQVDVMGMQKGAVDRSKGVYAQFTCLANSALRNDPCHLGYAIGPAAFATLIPPCSDITSENASLLAGRLFDFFDTNNDGFVSFDEFYIGRLLIYDSTSIERKRRIFRGFDLNGDGDVTRQELLRFFRALHDLNQDFIVHSLISQSSAEDNAEYGAPHEYIDGSRSIAAFWARSRAVFHSNAREGEGKITDAYGEVELEDQYESSDHGHVLADNTDDFFSRKDTIGGTYTSLRDDLERAFSCAVLREDHLDFGRYLTDLPSNGPPLEVVDHVLYLKHRVFIGAAQGRYLWIASNLSQDDSLPREVLRLCAESDSAISTSHPRLRHLQEVTIAGCLTKLQNSRNVRADLHLSTRAMVQNFHLPDEDNGFSASNGSAHLPGSDPASNNAVGRTAAARSIYTVTQQALNEMLDPLFFQLELCALWLQKRQAYVYKYAEEIQLVRKTKTLVTGLAPSDTARLKAASGTQAEFKTSYEKELTLLRIHVFVHRLDRSGILERWHELYEDLPLRYERDAAQQWGAWDPTMPQFRPARKKISLDNLPGVDRDSFLGAVYSWLEELVHCEDEIEEYFKSHQSWGAINEREWMEMMETQDENGERLLRWADDWVTLARI